MDTRPVVAASLATAAAVFCLVGFSAARADVRAAPIRDGPELDYQPAILRRSSSGDLLVVFERLDPATHSGDLMVTASDDDGGSWSNPAPAIATEDNERHPAVVELADGSLVLFYLSDAAEPGSYRIRRAISSDGQLWEPMGEIDLGWTTPGEINPSVVCGTDGVLTMAYHRLSGPSYVARSSDEGQTWDRQRTQVTRGSSALPRIDQSDANGMFVITYQTNPGNNSLNLWAQMTSDPYDWSAPPTPVSVGLNTHDSGPLLLPDGRLMVFYARQVGEAFDLFFRVEDADGGWLEEVRLTENQGYYDTQPHPLFDERGEAVTLVWPRQDSLTAAPYIDHDLWLMTDIMVDGAPPLPREVYIPIAFSGSGS